MLSSEHDKAIPSATFALTVRREQIPLFSIFINPVARSKNEKRIGLVGNLWGKFMGFPGKAFETKVNSSKLRRPSFSSYCRPFKMPRIFFVHGKFLYKILLIYPINEHIISNFMQSVFLDKLFISFLKKKKKFKAYFKEQESTHFL